MSNLTGRESMLSALAARLRDRLAAALAAGGDSPDPVALEGWLACWALASAGRGTALAQRAADLLQRPFQSMAPLAEPREGQLPAPFLQGVAALALWTPPLASEPALDGGRSLVARELNAAWRPAGHFAFAAGLLPVEPSAFQESLVAAAWAHLPDPVAERRTVRARKLLSHLRAGQPARPSSGRQGGEGGLALRLWAALVLAEHAGIEDAVPALLVAARTVRRGDLPEAAVERAALALALSAAASAAAEPAEAAAFRRDGARCLEEGFAPSTPDDIPAAALALVAVAALPAAPQPVSARPALKP